MLWTGIQASNSRLQTELPCPHKSAGSSGTLHFTNPTIADLDLATNPRINIKAIKSSKLQPLQRLYSQPFFSRQRAPATPSAFQTSAQAATFTIPSLCETSLAVAGSSALTALTFRTVKVDISHLLRASDSTESSPTAIQQARSTAPADSPPTTSASAPPYAAAHSGTGGKRSMPPHPSETPAKKQSKWSPEEDALIIELRGRNMKWEDISRQLPGRSAISCRLHYQNYLERRCDWSDEKKSKLARLYERFKPDMWAKVAEEMGVPWRAAEAMHWQLGEHDMARRAGVVPFSLSSVTMDAPSSGHVRPSSHRGHAHSHSTASGSTMSSAAPSPRYHREGPATRSLAARRDSLRGPSLPTSPQEQYPYERINPNVTMSGPPTSLPSVAEMTTGVSPYNTPAYSLAAPATSYRTSNSGPYLPSLGYPPRGHGNNEGKRTRSPEKEYRETSRRRQER